MRYLFAFCLFGILLPCQLSGKNKRKDYTQLISKIVSIINQSNFKGVIMILLIRLIFIQAQLAIQIEEIKGC